MPLANDGDIVHGLGYVALYAAYLEEQIDSLLNMLSPLEPFTEGEQRWPISKKISKAKRLILSLAFEQQTDLLADLEAAKDLFEWRNEIIHGRIYGGLDRPDYLKSGRPNTPDREIDSAELYDLANDLFAMLGSLQRPMIFQIPRALRGGE